MSSRRPAVCACRPSCPRPRALAAVALALAAACAAAQPRLLTVPQVDLQRYAGTWHEIARLPNRFQEQCAAEVTATYTPRDDGTVGVVNRCRTADGGWDVAEGVATPKDGSNAKLELSFLPAAIRWLPFGRGDYWVIELDSDYRWAMVGEPRREFLWVLSREPLLPQDVLESMLGRAREAGFPVDRIKLSAQKPPGGTSPAADVPPSPATPAPAAPAPAPAPAVPMPPTPPTIAPAAPSPSR